MEIIFLKIIDIDKGYKEIYNIKIKKIELEAILKYQYIPIRSEKKEIIPYRVESTTYNLEENTMIILVTKT